MRYEIERFVKIFGTVLLAADYSNALRDKVGELATDGSALDAASRTAMPSDAIYEDALSALVNLGYQRAAAEKALNQAASEGTEISVQKLLRRALQVLAK